METIKERDDQGKYRLEIHGFDYDNTKTRVIESDDSENTGLCMLNADYGGSSFSPGQVFPHGRSQRRPGEAGKKSEGEN